MTTTPTCPACGAPNPLTIVYGNLGAEAYAEVVADPDLEEGGCVVMPDSPKWTCRACGERFGRLEMGEE